MTRRRATFAIEWTIVLASLTATTDVLARGIYYGDVTDGAVKECDMLQWSGKSDDANAC